MIMMRYTAKGGFFMTSHRLGGGRWFPSHLSRVPGWGSVNLSHLSRHHPWSDCGPHLLVRTYTAVDWSHASEYFVF